ncbi:hypothetical protein Caci_3817 [Catenulispora acidiphila DSM 44928]|uniref:Uncharacterized protein n=1 Tax=Catenulispora acidiphila (strain DSM 44928 / JCM 14897 / NBRC 102108 / NRRL B-24433 / ID139908) TaxID=479433 RepID=C7QDC5_CATAD|nr:hypothetical protein [Catenulispora acidiphila]ACU72718.1 hypothetical protein Caci_3817 [Catenulispora acidiphila DSM 44928]
MAARGPRVGSGPAAAPIATFGAIAAPVAHRRARRPVGDRYGNLEVAAWTDPALTTIHIEIQV